jgi:hypothetical protein
MERATSPKGTSVFSTFVINCGPTSKIPIGLEGAAGLLTRNFLAFKSSTDRENVGGYQ